MCITSETCRAKSVIKLALNNLHQAGPSKPIYNDAWKHKNQKSYDPSLLCKHEVVPVRAMKPCGGTNLLSLNLINLITR